MTWARVGLMRRRARVCSRMAATSSSEGIEAGAATGGAAGFGWAKAPGRSAAESRRVTRHLVVR